MKTIFITLGILGFIFLFIMVLIMLGQLNDLCEYEKKIKRAREYILNHKLDRKQGTTTRLEAFTMEERELLEILGENKQ